MRVSKPLAASLQSEPVKSPNGSPQKVGSKYGNRFTEVDGIKFHSAKEARRYSELKLMEKAGEIQELTLQPRFKLVVNGLPVTTYVADFQYRYRTPLGEHDALVVEDVKGHKTDVYKIKAKLFRAVHGFPIKEV